MELLNIEPVITDSFTATVLALERAISGKKIIGTVSTHGVGFKFAAKRFTLKHYLGVIYANVEDTPVSDVLCSIDEALSNIRTSDIDRKKVSIHELTLKINSRIHLYDKCLLILDNCNFTPGQLKYFIRFLSKFNKSIGLVFRVNQNYYNALKGKNKKWVGLYNRLLKVTDDWKEIPGPSMEDIGEICKAHGITDEMIIDDLIDKHGCNLSRIRKSMDRYFELKTKQHETKEKFSAKNRSQASKGRKRTSRYKEHQSK